MGSIFGIYNEAVDIGELKNKASLLFSGGSNLNVDILTVPERHLLFGIYRSQDSAPHDGLTRDNGSMVVFSGNMINFRELCISLDLLPEETTRPQLFLAVWRKFGLTTPSQINGLFSAAIWDHDQQRLFVFSDRIGGFYTVFYAASNKSFTFSNRLPFVLQLAAISPEVDTRSFSTFFRNGYVLPPHTFVKNVSKNWPGEAIIYDGMRVTREFVDLVPSEPSGGRTRSVGEWEETLRDSLQAIMSEEQELGFLLSGGIDSSSIVALASEISSEPLTTFSAGFPGTSFDESPYAVMVAEKYGCRSHVLDMTRSDGLESLPVMTWWHNEPTLDYSCLPTYEIFSRTRPFFPAVVGGDGPDHFFGRYYPIAAKQSIRTLRPVYRLAYALTRKDYFNHLAYNATLNLTDAYMGLFAVPAWGTATVPPMHCLMASGIEMEPYPFDPMLPGDLNRPSSSYEELFHKTVYLDTLVDGAFGVFKKVGCMSLASNVRLCLPFMDRRIQDFIFALPRQQRVNGSFIRAFFSRARVKYLWKYGMGPKVLPPQVISKTKGGFTPPLVDWLKNSVCRLPAQKLLSPELLDAGFINPDYVDAMLTQHRNGERHWTSLLFMLLTFDLWFQMMICHPTPVPPQQSYSEMLEKHGSQRKKAFGE
jgi:asparagine synthase (glutamine-hydrolysing)